MNRLAGEKSPYLLQHAANPVDWHPWGEEAFETARREDKPVFLSVGYSTCHWCHVMERESFSDEDVARALEAKPSGADGTARGAEWESRKLPGFFILKKMPRRERGLFFYK